MKTKKFYIIFSLLLLVSIIMSYNLALYCFFWVAMCLFLLSINGLPKDNLYLKKTTIRIIIISIMGYFLVVYSLGFILGFNTNILKTDFISILSNTFIPIVIIISQEIIRYIYARKSQHKLFMIVLITVILTIIDIIIEINFQTFTNFETVFIFFTTVVCTKIATNILYSYISYKISIVPTIIHKLIFNLYIFILPIFPALGNYLNSIIGILYPYLIYKKINNNLIKYDKYENTRINYKERSYVLLIVPLIIIVIMVSGIFNYQLVAIASGSMEPTIFRGDAILIKKKNIKNIEIGDVLAYKKDNRLIAHRVIGMDKKGKIYVYKTKGDNNNKADDYIVSENEIIGIVKYNIKYIGYPTVIFNELMNYRR